VERVIGGPRWYRIGPAYYCRKYMYVDLKNSDARPRIVLLHDERRVIETREIASRGYGFDRQGV
jgi:hypothetical protein